MCYTAGICYVVYLLNKFYTSLYLQAKTTVYPMYSGKGSSNIDALFQRVVAARFG